MGPLHLRLYTELLPTLLRCSGHQETSGSNAAVSALKSGGIAGVERLQVELLGGLGRDELHRRALHRLGNCLGIAEVVLLPPRVGTHIFGWHQPSVVTKRCEFAAQMVCADAGLHANETRRQVGEPYFYLAA